MLERKLTNPERSYARAVYCLENGRWGKLSARLSFSWLASEEIVAANPAQIPHTVANKHVNGFAIAVSESVGDAN